MKPTHTEVTITLDDVPRAIHRDSWRVFIRPAESHLVPADIPVNLDAKLHWSELDKLTRLTQIRYTGKDVGVEAYVASRPTLRELAWHKHSKSLINLQSTALKNITIECGEADLTLKLPNSGSAKQLILNAAGDLSNLRVASQNLGEGLDLTIWYLEKPGTPVSIRGLKRIQSLSIWHAAKVDLAAFAQCTEIEKLDIRDPQSSIENIGTLKRFTKLRSLRIKDCYNFGNDDFPLPALLPELESMEFDGIRSEDAKKLSDRFKGFPGLSIRGKRTEAWLRKSHGNPFFAWTSEHGKELGSKACRIYNAAAMAVDKLDASATATDVQVILKKFVSSFNRLDLDTIMREEVADAFGELIKRRSDLVSKKQAAKWIDDWREF